MRESIEKKHRGDRQTCTVIGLFCPVFTDELSIAGCGAAAFTHRAECDVPVVRRRGGQQSEESHPEEAAWWDLAIEEFDTTDGLAMFPSNDKPLPVPETPIRISGKHVNATPKRSLKSIQNGS